jgi:hypothetical protein
MAAIFNFSSGVGCRIRLQESHLGDCSPPLPFDLEILHERVRYVEHRVATTPKELGYQVEFTPLAPACIGDFDG